jgi:hypothetical protein
VLNLALTHKKRITVLCISLPCLSIFVLSLIHLFSLPMYLSQPLSCYLCPLLCVHRLLPFPFFFCFSLFLFHFYLCLPFSLFLSFFKTPSTHFSSISVVISHLLYFPLNLSTYVPSYPYQSLYSSYVSLCLLSCSQWCSMYLLYRLMSSAFSPLPSIFLPSSGSPYPLIPVFIFPQFLSSYTKNYLFLSPPILLFSLFLYLCFSSPFFFYETPFSFSSLSPLAFFSWLSLWIHLLSLSFSSFFLCIALNPLLL